MYLNWGHNKWLGLLTCLASCTDSEECRKGKITSYQDGFWCFYSAPPRCQTLLGGRAPHWLCKPTVRKHAALALTSVEGRTSVLTVRFARDSVGWEGKSALADFGVVGEWGGGQLSALPNSSGMTFRPLFFPLLCFRFSTLANDPHALLKEKIAAIIWGLPSCRWPPSLPFSCFSPLQDQSVPPPRLWVSSPTLSRTFTLSVMPSLTCIPPLGWIPLIDVQMCSFHPF